MIPMRSPRTLLGLAALYIILGAGLAGCGSPAPRLRITNSGAQAIKNLTVLFPEDRIEFGDVPAGSTTDYKPVPNGVYSYAAYQYEVNGLSTTQPVIDWVGEKPMAGDSFTYTIDVDASRPELQRVQLSSVTRDD
jgi:hypothetical protein